MNWILNNDITKHLLKTYLPYLIAFLLGVIVAWKGCGDSSGKPITTIIEKPVPTIEYVDRWRTDTVRFVFREFVTVRDTITSETIVNRLDTLFLIDTVSIVEAWLTELVKYDTAVTLNGVNVALKWQNYQNLSEQLSITVKEKVVGAKFALGIHANVGLLSNFKDSHIPLMGVGLQATINKGYYGIDYGFNGDHYVGLKVGRNIISR
jgi:PBP1b-binding outer membrane lipoprotein LpoB